MDFLIELGPLALASRLRRLTERLTQDVAQVYKQRDIDFEPRWFPVFYLLSRQAPIAIVDISRELGVSHPAVNQIAGELIRHGLVRPLKDKTDKRKRLLTLTEKGEALLPELRLIWGDVSLAVQELLSSTGEDVLRTIETLEANLEEQGIHARFIALQKKESATPTIEIIEFQPRYRQAFKSLNTEWIEKFFRLEPEDQRMLENPEGEILEKGGFIFFARENATAQPSAQDILGTCALIRHEEGIYELAKMGVTEAAQGRRIGHQLIEAAIGKAKAIGAKAIVLETNSVLNTAIHLYRKMGFVDIPLDPDSKYERADTHMRLDLL